MSFIGIPALTGSVGEGSGGEIFGTNKLVLIGTSITNSYFRKSGGTEATYYHDGISYVFWFLAYLGQPFSDVQNFAVSGSTTNDHVAIFNGIAKQAISKADLVIYEPGPNDMMSVPVQDTINNINSIVTKLVKAKKKVILIAPTDRDTTTDVQRSSRYQAIAECSRLSYKYPEQILYINFDSILSTGAVDAKFGSYFFDGTHLTTAGAHACGRFIARRIGIQYKPFNLYAKSARNYLVNPTMALHLTADDGFELGNGAVKGSNLSLAANINAACVKLTGFPDVFTGSDLNIQVVRDYNEDTMHSIKVNLTGVNKTYRMCLASCFGVAPLTDTPEWTSALARSTIYNLSTHFVAHPTNTSKLLKLHLPGTTAATVPSFSSVEGDIIQDGTAKWMVVNKPKAGDKFVSFIRMSASGFMLFGVINRMFRDNLNSGEVFYDIHMPNYEYFNGSPPQGGFGVSFKAGEQFILMSQPFEIPASATGVSPKRAMLDLIVRQLTGASSNLTIYEAGIVRVSD